MRVCAIVITYNRKECLKKLLAALNSQTKALDSILVFDNDSSDGTEKMLLDSGFVEDIEAGILQKKDKCLYFGNTENSGGSGGFHDAIEIASKLDFDYLWCMDDDVSPEPDCLEELLKHVSDDVRICLPTRTDKNFQDRAVVKLDESNPFKYTIASRKTMLCNDQISGDTIEVVDMPFEGPLISTSLIKEIGYPKKELFIIFDDTEYAARARKFTKIVYCKKAILHKQIIPQKQSNSSMNWKNYYGFRNQFWFDRTYGTNVFVRRLRPWLSTVTVIFAAVAKRKFNNIKVIKKAYYDGTRGTLGKTVAPGTAGKDF